MITLVAVTTGAAIALLALSGCSSEPAPQAPTSIAPPAAPALAPTPQRPELEAETVGSKGQGFTCELDEGVGTDVNGVITNRACGEHPTAATGGPAEGQDFDNPPFVSGGNSNVPADGDPLPPYDPSRQRPQECADASLTQLCAADVYADYEPCAAYR